MWISRKTYNELMIHKVNYDLRDQINNIYMNGYNNGSNNEQLRERLTKAAAIIREKNDLIEKLMEIVPQEEVNKLTIYFYKQNFYNRNDQI